MRKTIGLTACLAGALWAAGGAFPARAEDARRHNEPCYTEGQEQMDWLDYTHSYLSDNVCGAAVWFDDFFGNERADEEGVDRYIRLTPYVRWKEREGMSSGANLRARIDLPKLKRNLNLILSNEDDSDITRRPIDNEASVPKNLKQGEKYALAVRWSPVRKPQSSFSTTAGITGGTPLKPYLKFRYRYTHGLDETSLARFTQTVFWKNQEGVGESSRVDLEKLLNPLDLVRFSTAATYSEISDGIEWDVGVSLYRNFSDKEAISFNVFANGYDDPESDLRDTGVSMRYRRNVYRPWLFLELEPALTWPRHRPEDDPADRDIHAAFSFTVYLEIQFGRKKDAFGNF